MKIELGGIKNDIYSNFVESIRNAGTRRHYTRNLDSFLNLIPDSVFEDSMGKAPISRNDRDLADAFVILAKQNLDAAKSIIKSYIREINKEVDSGKISPNTVANKIKPIKALLVTNDIDISLTCLVSSSPFSAIVFVPKYEQFHIHDTLRNKSSSPIWRSSI